MTVTMISTDTTACTCTRIPGNDNTGSGIPGYNQYYLYEVAYAPGTTTANTPLAIELYNGQPIPSPSQLENFFIVGPGDFLVPPTGNTTWSFDRSNPFALSGQYLSRLRSGIGAARWVDATLGFANYCAMSQPWEEPQLGAFSGIPAITRPTRSPTPRPGHSLQARVLSSIPPGWVRSGWDRPGPVPQASPQQSRA